MNCYFLRRINSLVSGFMEYTYEISVVKKTIDLIEILFLIDLMCFEAVLIGLILFDEVVLISHHFWIKMRFVSQN